MFSKENVIIRNTSDDPVTKNIFEIREFCCLFTGYFSKCPYPGSTSDTQTYKNYGVFVSFIHYKSIITPRSFDWDLRTQYGITNDDVHNYIFIPLINRLTSIIFILSGL